MDAHESTETLLTRFDAALRRIQALRERLGNEMKRLGTTAQRHGNRSAGDPSKSVRTSPSRK